MSTSLETLRTESKTQGIGRELMDLLDRVVTSTARQYPAALYSKTQVWDKDSFADLKHDWVEARLLRRGDLAAMLAVASDTKVFRSMLTRSLSQFIINQRHRSSATNLFKRLQVMLAADPRFRRVPPVTKSSSQLWTLTEGGWDDPSQASLRGLVATTQDLTDEALHVVRYGPHALKSSPILRDAPLGEFVCHLLGAAKGALSHAQIADVLSSRFNLAEVEPQVLDNTAISREHPIAVTVELDDLSQSVIARMGRKRVQALREFHRSDGSMLATAEALGIPKAEAVQLIEEVMALVAEISDSFDEAQSVYERIIESLF